MNRKSYKKRRGATLVEFAFVVPILLLIVLGILEFGWYARNQLIVANATREGARAASVGRTRDEIRTRIINAARPLPVTINNITLRFSTDQGRNYSDFPSDNTLKSPPQNGVPPEALVQVSVNVSHGRLVNLPITPARIATQVTIMREY